MSQIKNSGLDQRGAKPFEQEQFGTAGAEGVKEFDNIILWMTRSISHRGLLSDGFL